MYPIGLTPRMLPALLSRVEAHKAQGNVANPEEGKERTDRDREHEENQVLRTSSELLDPAVLEARSTPRYLRVSSISLYS